ncbi:2-dehydro-3-deoxygluconokinase [Pseudobythopirellula maris]|uniref:2-dehydro-3-deoxygluconokinase n=1 Tax=Pseudobythopirellula maris TaxID=2527991 RepID=A0A5C5ZS54_9BACT|nr:carbohydrate kinase [Pseudobythopirellula maris]TWT90130.1 2-dehydro-3-deoxygluconokinase [Pseudobythopirellula maris]
MNETQSNEAKRPVVVGIGEVLWDHSERGRHAGGAPANVVYHTSRLGCESVLLTRIGPDQAGEELLADLAGKGFDTSHVQRDPDRPTGTAHVGNNADGDPDFEITANVAWDYLTIGVDENRLLQDADALYFGTLAQRTPAAREAIQRALALAPSGCRRVLDVNLRAPWYDTETLVGSLRLADTVKFSSGESDEMAQLLGLGIAEPEPIAEELQSKYGVKRVCVTLGAEGCRLFEGDSSAEAAGVSPSEKIDTVGAGDAFTSAMIVGLLGGWSLNKIAEFANRYAAATTTQPGAMPPIEGAAFEAALAMIPN